MEEGAWSKDDIRRVFVAGAAWWENYSAAATMSDSDIRIAEAEAEKRYKIEEKENSRPE